MPSAFSRFSTEVFAEGSRRRQYFGAHQNLSRRAALARAGHARLFDGVGERARRAARVAWTNHRARTRSRESARSASVSSRVLFLVRDEDGQRIFVPDPPCTPELLIEQAREDQGTCLGGAESEFQPLAQTADEAARIGGWDPSGEADLDDRARIYAVFQPFWAGGVVVGVWCLGV